METKSRYEIIAELETKKAALLNAKASVGLQEAELNRNVERAEESLKEFVSIKAMQETNIKEQLESIEKSLGRLDNSQKK